MDYTLTVQTDVHLYDIAVEVARDPEQAFELVALLSARIADTTWDDRVIEMLKEGR